MVSPALMLKVIAQAERLATHSWEYGSLSLALIDWYSPKISVFSSTAFPNGSLPVLGVNTTQALAYAEPKIRLNSSTLIDGDGAAGDPASLGTTALLIGQTDASYTAASTRQAQHLLEVVPRWSNGAISHREGYAELWADSTFMVPPFLAYYAVATANLTTLKEAIRQCSLYGEVLGVPPIDNSTAGLWHHITGPKTNDSGLWSTGNGWAAAGISRVLAIAKHSSFAPFLYEEMNTLKGIIKGILDAAIGLDNAEPGELLLRNYLNDTSWFGELSGTTLLAATAYRAAKLAPETFGDEYVQWAEKKRVVIEGHIGNSTGLLAPVVNPLGWGDRKPATESPEAQGFAIMLFAAERSFKGEYR